MHAVNTSALQTLDQNRIVQFGREIFRRLGREQPSAFNKQFWSAQLMEWAMHHPEFKVNLFRLVDVLPTLKSSRAIAEHVGEYLGGIEGAFPGALSWGVKVPPKSIRAKIMAGLVRKGVREMAGQFIAGETPHDAVSILRRLRRKKAAFTVDLLGEFTLSEVEADQYLNRYLEALDVFAHEISPWPESSPIINGHPGELAPICVSVKLTALYSQCSVLNFNRSVEVLTERLTTIAKRALKCGALVYVDAEDSANNPIIYETFKQTFSNPELSALPFPGIVIQAYAKDAGLVVNDMLEFARRRGAPIAVRLVKGAYWDHETISANLNDWESPLFKYKESSDANFEALSRLLLDNHEVCLPAFGSHNIRSLSHACCYAEKIGVSKKQFELQMLYGMADPIARAFTHNGYLVRFYVPLGDLFVGMGYLVRRLLENTSNESFLKHTFFDAAAVDMLLTEPRLHE